MHGMVMIDDVVVHETHDATQMYRQRTIISDFDLNVPGDHQTGTWYPYIPG
jgi:hypothetical protein